jgi:hypothetical protein
MYVLILLSSENLVNTGDLLAQFIVNQTVLCSNWPTQRLACDWSTCLLQKVKLFHHLRTEPQLLL